MLHFHVYKLLYTKVVEQCNSYYLFMSLFWITSCSHYKNSVIVNSLVFVLLNVIVIPELIHSTKSLYEKFNTFQHTLIEYELFDCCYCWTLECFMSRIFWVTGKMAAMCQSDAILNFCNIVDREFVPGKVIEFDESWGYGSKPP